jgi:signal transduction histidine kinase
MSTALGARPSFAAQALERLGLAQQAFAAGIVAAGVGAGVIAWSGSGPVAPALALAALTALAAAAPVWRARRAHAGTAAAAHRIAHEDCGDDATLPLHTESRDWLETSSALRRAIAALQGRIGALKALNATLSAKLQSRTVELTALQDLSIGLAQQGDVVTLVDEALAALELTVSYSSASVWARAELEPVAPVQLLGYRSRERDLGGLALADLSGLRLSRTHVQRYEQIERDGEPVVENRPRQGLLEWLWTMVTDDARTSALYRHTRSWMAVPLKVRARVLGVLRVDHAEPDAFDPERVHLLRAVAGQTALALRHAQLQVHERELAVIGERNRIARDLHDAVSQTLFAASLLAGTLAQDGSLGERAREQALALERLARGALAEMRMLLFELRPDALEQAPLAELLQHASAALAARGELVLEAHIDPLEPPPAPRVQVYRIAQEALANVARHSRARHARLHWERLGPTRGRLVVADDGDGFDPASSRPGHFGLANMRQRAAELGAALAIHSAPGDGTRVELELQWQ